MTRQLCVTRLDSTRDPCDSWLDSTRALISVTRDSTRTRPSWLVTRLGTRPKWLVNSSAMTTTLPTDSVSADTEGSILPDRSFQICTNPQLWKAYRSWSQKKLCCVIFPCGYHKNKMSSLYVWEYPVQHFLQIIDKQFHDHTWRCWPPPPNPQHLPPLVVQ